jgi:CRP-like cAMP-binding protein
MLRQRAFALPPCAVRILVRQGDAVDQVSLCLSGSFRVMINSADGQAVLLRFLMPGEHFGLSSMFAGAAFPTDVICKQDGETLSLNKLALERLLVNQPVRAIGLIESLVIRVAELFSLTEATLLQSLRQRVHLRLIVLANAPGERLCDGSVRLSLSQQDFARAVNASRQLSYAQILASVKSRFRGGFSSDSTGEGS